MHGNLTTAEVQTFADVIAACQRNASVRWLDPNGVDVRTGVMRHVCRDESGNFLSGTDDVRDAVVRITTTDTGTEVFLPLPQFAGWTASGYVAFDN